MGDDVVLRMVKNINMYEEAEVGPYGVSGGEDFGEVIWEGAGAEALSRGMGLGACGE